MRLIKQTAVLMAATASITASAALWAQPYPAKPVRFVNGSSAGASVDIVARVFAAGLSPVLGQQVIVDNRPGGASNIAADIVARSAPDGHTLFDVTSTHALNASLFPDLKYDLIRDFAPVTNLVIGAHVMVVNPKLAANSIQEFIKLAKTRPGQINYASAGVGTSAFLAAEKFKSRAGVDLMHVPYKGGAQALAGVASGEVGVMFASLAGAASLVKAGRARALGVTALQRMQALADAPTVAESGFPGFVTGTFNGILVPAKTPRSVVDVLHKASTAAMNNADVSKRLVDLGYGIVADRPEEFGAFLKEEIQELAKMAKEFNLKAEGS